MGVKDHYLTVQSNTLNQPYCPAYHIRFSNCLLLFYFWTAEAKLCVFLLNAHEIKKYSTKICLYTTNRTFYRHKNKKPIKTKEAIVPTPGSKRSGIVRLGNISKKSRPSRRLRPRHPAKKLLSRR